MTPAPAPIISILTTVTSTVTVEKCDHCPHTKCHFEIDRTNVVVHEEKEIVIHRNLESCIDILFIWLNLHLEMDCCQPVIHKTHHQEQPAIVISEKNGRKINEGCAKMLLESVRALIPRKAHYHLEYEALSDKGLRIVALDSNKQKQGKPDQFEKTKGRSNNGNKLKPFFI